MAPIIYHDLLQRESLTQRSLTNKKQILRLTELSPNPKISRYKICVICWSDTGGRLGAHKHQGDRESDYAMKNRFLSFRLTLFKCPALLVPLLLFACATPSIAVNTWDGGSTGPGDDLWSTAVNWDTDTAPVFPAALTFAGNTRLSPSNDFAGASVTGITFAASAGAFNLIGTPINLSGSIGVNVGGSVTNDQTVSLPITLNANTTVTSGNSGGSTATGKGVLLLNAPISGSYGLTTGGKNYVQFNATNTYTGDTLITATGVDPSVSIGCDNPFGTGLVKFGPYVGSGQLWVVASGADRTITNNVDINTGLFITHDATVAVKSPGNLTLSGTVLLHSSNGIYMNTKNLILAGSVVGGGNGGYNIELRSGKLVLAGNNTFTNSIRIATPGYGQPRTLNFNSDAALGHTNNSIRLETSATLQVPASTNVTLAPSRLLDLQPGRIVTFDIPSGSSLSWSGPVTNTGAIVKGNSGTLNLTGNNTFSGGISLWGGTLGLSADSGLGTQPPSALTSSVAFASSSTLRALASHTIATNRTFWIGTNLTATFDSQSSTQTIRGVITGGAGTWLAKSGAGMVALDPGDGRTNSVHSVRVFSGTLAFLSGTHLVNSNTVWNLYPIFDIFHINGGGVLVGGGTLMTTGDGYVTIQNGSLTVTNGTANFNSVQELLNAYTGTGNTTVGGSGVLDLKVLRITQSGTPAVSNVVNVNAGGTIKLRNFFIDTAQAAPYGTVNLNGGTLLAKIPTDGFLGYNVPKWTTNVFFYVLSGGAIIDSGTNAIMAQLPLLSGAPNDGGLTKRGNGLLTLANTNTYTGVTSIEAGMLRLYYPGTLQPACSVLVASNAVFDVNGKAQTLAGLGGSGVVTNNSQLAVTASVAPGGTNAVGTLTLAASPAALAGTFVVDVATNGACDRLNVLGNLDVSGLTLSLANPGSLNKNVKYVIASCAGTLSGTFLSAPLPTRWHVTYDTSAREVRLSYNFGTLFLLN